ncbi:MAG: 23S rRNA (adenine(2503)-C(2))-methyltransferase RlmN [Burkholderiales bacterium]|nr:23S rRNA (adenine(2503)-C(2))-methyltransferase RlmN [Burkholderiales bacterium]
MKNIYGYTLKELEDYFFKNNDKKFKATQVYEWLYKKRVNDFNDMKNIKKEVIQKLEADFSCNKLDIINKLEDVDVYKYLFKLDDNNKIEAVLMKHDYGNSLCVSTQVGCNIGCTFCESGRLKKVRNLESYEMVLQILQIEADLNIRISHVVLMGIGEPFDNYDSVINFIEIINDSKGIDIGARHITISTSGIVPKIEKFMLEGKQVNLAISLHASNDSLRDKLMPINKVYNLKQLIGIVKKYINLTNRRVTFEYIMLKGINDSESLALELSLLLKGINCYVNLIPYNETSHIEYKKSSNDDVMKFYDILKKNKINVTVRREFGTKVMAACGQLRSNYEEAE